MRKETGPPTDTRRTGPEDYFDFALDEVFERLPPDRVPERELVDLARELLDLVRELVDLARERELLDLGRELLALARELLALVRELLALVDPDREPLLDRPFDELRELLDERRELDRRRDDPPLRSAAGI